LIKSFGCNCYSLPTPSCSKILSLGFGWLIHLDEELEAMKMIMALKSPEAAGWIKRAYLPFYLMLKV